MSSTLSAVRRSRIPALAAAVCTVAAGLTLGAPAAHAVPVTEWEFAEAGQHSWVAPDGVDQVYVELYGARGGGWGSNSFGGYGAVVTTVLDVIPGDTYEVYVGGPGDGANSGTVPHAGGFNGGGDGGARGVNGVGAGGGGATDIRWDGTALGDRIMIAGGGGGGAPGW